MFAFQSMNGKAELLQTSVIQKDKSIIKKRTAPAPSVCPILMTSKMHKNTVHNEQKLNITCVDF